MERPLPAYMEVANLEHRLAGLHDKQKAFAKQSDISKRATWIAIPAVSAAVVWVAFTRLHDPAPMLLLFSILIPVWALVAWVYRHSDWSVDFNHFGPINRYTSYRVFLEENIKDCEKLLAELKAKP